MGSLPTMMGPAPPPGPDVASQMGAGPPGLAAIAARQQETALGPEGAPNPHGLLFAQANTVKSVLEKMAGDEPTFAPFAREAISAITNGVSAVSAAPPAQALPPELAGAPPGVPTPPLA